MERLSLCIRNLGRHAWRTRIIVLIALLGAFLTFLFENLIDDISRKQSDMFGRAFSGHFLVLDKEIETRNTFGFYYARPEQMMDPGQVARVRRFLGSLPEVSGSQERIIFSGLYYGEKDAERGFRGVAMDMGVYDRNFTDMYVARGAPLAVGEQGACAPSWYEFEQKKNLAIGQSYVFLLPNRNGEFVDREVLAKGGIDYHSMPKDAIGISSIFFDLEGFRAMVGYERPDATEVVGFLKDARTSGRVLPLVQQWLAANEPGLKVVSWREYAPIFAEIVLGFDVALKTLEGILLVICVLLVVKLTTFSIIERYSEIGTLRAMGFSRADIAFQFTLEGFLAIAAGAAIGFLLAAGLVAALHASGVHNHAIFFSYMIGDGFRPSFHSAKVVRVAGVFLAVALLAPLLPAIQGGRLSILRTLEKR
ncbi:MAG TPA: FtsX-like permease family protein [Spirochaetia bacterium]|nr:FtsX-like permease family protein [Spirochaetia bacterium]